jgi:branched-chain amino acid aminotransferase
LGLQDHLRRLAASARAILLPLPLPLREIGRAVCATIRANGLRDAYVRLLVTRGPGDLGLDMRKCRQGPTMIIIVGEISLYPERAYTQGLDLVISSYRQKGLDQVPPAVKSLNYLLNVLARAEASRSRAQEAVLLNAAGQVSECTGDNIFYVKRGDIFTPPLSAGILEGVTRGIVMELARRHFGRTVTQKACAPADLRAADEIFLTGTGAEVVPAVKLNGRAIGGGAPGPVTRTLIRLFREYAAGHGTSVY